MEKPLEAMSDDELKDLIQQAEKTLEKRAAQRRRETLAEARRLAASVGFEVDFRKTGEGHREAPRAKPAAKFRNPRNPEETWSGRGRPPKWLRELRAEGLEAEPIDQGDGSDGDGASG